MRKLATLFVSLQMAAFGLMGCSTTQITKAAASIAAPLAQQVIQQQVIQQAPTPKMTSITLTVKKGDTLWALTQAGAGNPFLWPLLWKANRDIVVNPDLIEVGQLLDVPVYTEASDEAWAIAFAEAKK